MKKILLISLIFSLIIMGCTSSKEIEENTKYGVFLNYDKSLDNLSDYDVVVIDAQYYSKEAIEEFKADGHTVYSYINIGSLEDFRPYYDEYKNLTLDDYENWEEEKWVDVTSERWQDFIINSLANELINKDIDGFFVDNCDVYYHYPTEDMLEGVSTIMKALVATEKDVIINGGDVYLDAYCKNGGNWNDVITGINQETVFSKIDFDHNKLGVNFREDREYYTNYIEKYSKLGATIYLLEYTDDSELETQIKNYCDKHNFLYYITDSIELDQIE